MADEVRSRRMTWVDFVARERDLVYDLRFPEGDGEVFFLIKIEPAKHQAFKDVLATPQIIDLRDYGTILYSGWGEPDEEIKDEMRFRYRMYLDA
ncbi:hypothetical protein ACFQ1L_24320 [Phytohabitans flavus]|nr:hypothetical protein [Phytohabitans flavus]